MMFMELIAESPRNAFFVICLMAGLLLFGFGLYLNPGRHEKIIERKHEKVAGKSQDTGKVTDRIYRIK